MISPTFAGTMLAFLHSQGSWTWRFSRTACSPSKTSVRANSEEHRATRVRVRSSMRTIDRIGYVRYLGTGIKRPSPRERFAKVKERKVITSLVRSMQVIHTKEPQQTINIVLFNIKEEN